jgi:hypothetical protein
MVTNMTSHALRHGQAAGTRLAGDQASARHCPHADRCHAESPPAPQVLSIDLDLKDECIDLDRSLQLVLEGGKVILVSRVTHVLHSSRRVP